MVMDIGGIDRVQQAVAQAVREHWELFLVEGIVLVVLGVLAILVPMVATIAVTILIGGLLLISGVVGLITTLRMRNAPAFWRSLPSAVLGIVAGIILLGWPVLGAVSLTLLLTVFFTIEGVASIMYDLSAEISFGVGPNRRRWGPHPRVYFRSDFQKLPPFRMGSRFDADLHWWPRLTLVHLAVALGRPVWLLYQLR
jgi:hypothetical protein